MQQELQEFLASPIPWLAVGIILGLMSVYTKKKH